MDSCERVTVNLSAKASKALAETVNLTGDTKTDTISKALQLWEYLQSVQSRGGTVHVTDGGERELIRFL